MKTPVGFTPSAFPESGSKRIAQSSNSSLRTTKEFATGFLLSDKAFAPSSS
jgi:hypothetical protein